MGRRAVRFKALTAFAQGATTRRMIPFPDISPTLFEIDIGPVTLAIRWYALAYIAGILLGWRLLAMTLARPRLWPGDTAPMTKEDLDDYVTWLILGVILGGRLGFVLFYEPAHYLAHPGDIPKVWEGGMSFHGGFLGVVVSAWIFANRRGLSKLSLADGLALATPPGLLFGRIANFINAELWGRPTDLPWGVVFPGAAAQLCPDMRAICARHPSQLYEAALEGLILGVVLITLAWRRDWLKTPGGICGLFLLGYGAARFFVEFFRVADAQFITAENPLGWVVQAGPVGLSMGQLLSLPMILLGAFMIRRARQRA